MKPSFRDYSTTITLVLSLTALAGCVAYGPTLEETRRGQGRVTTDTSLQAGEIRAEVLRLQPNRNEIEVRSDGNRTRVLSYDPVTTRVAYHGRDYSAEQLQAGDVIAYQTRPRSDMVDTIRIQEPVQARATSATASRSPLPPRRQVIEGTVERIDSDRGIFEVRTRDRENVTVTLPYNARTADVDEFRRLRAGDTVRLEGEFVTRDSFQVSAFTR